MLEYTADKRTMQQTILWVGFLVFLFLFRTVYGLWSEFWFEDELQIFLIGLKYYTTGKWPFFGPDVIYTQSQIPGALQGLLVGAPLRLIQIPEAPIILLNIMSFASLALMAWYFCKRFPQYSRFFVWAWLMTCPWVMVFSSHIINPSYVLPFSVLFFVGLFDTFIYAENSLIPKWASFLMMGFATTAVMQIHMSWVMFVPLTLAPLYVQVRKSFKAFVSSSGVYLVGALIGAATLIPTLIFYRNTSGDVGNNIVFTLSHAKDFLTIIARFFSFASFEAPYILGGTTTGRVAVIKDHLWMTPFALTLLVVGWAQALFMLVSFFLKNDLPHWSRVRWFTFSTIILLYCSYFFSIKGPSSHTFYCMFPLAMLYSFYCYNRLIKYKKWWKYGSLLFVCFGFFFYVGLGMYNYEKKSLYKNRSRVVEAMTKKDYKILGLRRSDILGKGY